MIKRVSDFRSNIISRDKTLVDAMTQLDKQMIKTLFVEDEQGKLIASITDGDIRRAILKGAVLSDSIEKIAHYNPTVIYEDNLESASIFMQEKLINAIPYVENSEIKSIYFNINSSKVYERHFETKTPVVIMAGGQGKRLYPYTKILPKPLIPIEDTPISQRIIEGFIKCGCKDFYMVVNYKKNMIKAYYADADLDCSLNFVDEDKPLGTGGGLRLLQKEINETFILTNCDILILEDVGQIVEHHKKENNVVTMVCSLKNYVIPYGVVNFTEGGEICSFEEKPKMSFFTNTGYYILEPEVMTYINENENIGMPDIIQRIKENGGKVGIYPISESSWLDMGQFDSMEGMERKLREINKC